MYARRVLPFLLIGGAVMMLMHHHHTGLAGQSTEGEPRHPIGPHGRSHGEWGKRVPPLFEVWHKRAHEQEAQATAI